MSKYQHAAAELRYIADILDALNRVPEPNSDVAVDGALTLYWSDCEMGTIELDDENDLRSWVYFAKDREPKILNGDVHIGELISQARNADPCEKSS